MTLALLPHMSDLLRLSQADSCRVSLSEDRPGTALRNASIIAHLPRHAYEAWHAAQPLLASLLRWLSPGQAVDDSWSSCASS